jgi:hypothetical protein
LAFPIRGDATTIIIIIIIRGDATTIITITIIIIRGDATITIIIRGDATIIIIIRGDATNLGELNLLPWMSKFLLCKEHAAFTCWHV